MHSEVTAILSTYAHVLETAAGIGFGLILILAYKALS